MSYSSLAEVYDKLTENVEYEKRAEYIRSILLKNGGENGVLLDLACGTGTLSLELAKYGYDMILCDLSAEMLVFARERLPEALILCQSMTELDLYGTINHAVCSLDSINHLLKPCDVKAAFSSVSLFMEKGGVFVFDVNTIHKHENILGNNTFVSEKDNVFCVWQNTYKRKSKTVDINIDIFVEEENKYTRLRESFSERAYSLDDIKKWLDETGFEVTGVYDDMTENEPSETSERVYFTAVKR
ncbi:MAG: class I SAM-dependent methyltransferase [Clostridia bacterium]|nr:class I SAM-dependent methyltransferase [Clostridia bacterium]